MINPKAEAEARAMAEAMEDKATAIISNIAIATKMTVEIRASARVRPAIKAMKENMARKRNSIAPFSIPKIAREIPMRIPKRAPTTYRRAGGNDFVSIDSDMGFSFCFVQISRREI
tara:strand:- start:6829 stop:7176 length:348 start_codon:yes stop_codon:yes gene_type:complete